MRRPTWQRGTEGGQGQEPSPYANILVAVNAVVTEGLMSMGTGGS